MENDYIELAIDYTHNIYSCRHHKQGTFPYALQTITPVKFKGFYAKKIDEINNNFSVISKEDIFQIIARKPLNAMQLKKILGYSYPTIYEHLRKFQKLKLIKFTEGKSERGKREMKISLHDNVKCIPLTSKEKNFISFIRSIMKDSEGGLREFDSCLEKELKKISKKPTMKRASNNKKQKQKY